MWISTSPIVAEHKFDETHIRVLADQVQAKFEKSGRSVSAINILKPGVYPGDSAVQAFILLLTVMGIFALLL